MSKCSGVNRDRFLLNISPATENTRSEGTLVAGMHRYFLDNLYISGYLSLLFFHHKIALYSLFTTGSCNKKMWKI